MNIEILRQAIEGLANDDEFFVELDGETVCVDRVLTTSDHTSGTTYVLLECSK